MSAKPENERDPRFPLLSAGNAKTIRDLFGAPSEAIIDGEENEHKFMESGLEKLLNTVRSDAIIAQPVAWRPIESAPRDGTAILITRPTDFPSEEAFHVVRWDGSPGEGWWQVHDGKFDHPLRGPDPTGWSPLSAATPPPAEAQARVEALEAGLQFYADIENWTVTEVTLASACPAEDDMGERARALLSGSTPKPARVLDGLKRSPAIEELTPTNHEWDACVSIQDRYDLMKRKLDASFALLEVE